MEITEHGRPGRGLLAGVAAALLEHGHRTVLDRLARSGDWHCARVRAADLEAEGRVQDALDLLAVFSESHRNEVARRAAAILERAGRAEEAVAVLGARARVDSRVLGDHARLLRRCGRGDEAFDLLLPTIADWTLADTLVAVSEGLGRDDELADLLSPHVKSGFDPWSPGLEDAAGLLALVRARQGRVDEAIELFHGACFKAVNDRDRFADMLVEHGRFEELGDYINGSGGALAAASLIEVLESEGRFEAAAAVLAPLLDRRDLSASIMQAELLMRHRRTEAAANLLVPIPDSWMAESGYLLDLVCRLHSELGRPEVALEHLADLDRRCPHARFELLRARVGLLRRCGRADQAEAEARSHQRAGDPDAAWLIADVLAEDGRLEAAAAELRPHVGDAPWLREPLAVLLIRSGRIEEALTAGHY